MFCIRSCGFSEICWRPRDCFGQLDRKNQGKTIPALFSPKSEPSAAIGITSFVAHAVLCCLFLRGSGLIPFSFLAPSRQTTTMQIKMHSFSFLPAMFESAGPWWDDQAKDLEFAFSCRTCPAPIIPSSVLKYALTCPSFSSRENSASNVRLTAMRISLSRMVVHSSSAEIPNSNLPWLSKQVCPS